MTGPRSPGRPPDRPPFCFARRRIRLCTDQPMTALWETIGACGNPPKDGSYDFAVYAIILLVLTFAVVPIAIWRYVVT